MKWTPEIRAELVKGTSEGLILADACKAAGVSERSVKGWLARGRREGSGDYFEFASAIEQARAAVAGREEAMTAEELFVVVSRTARRGSVQAMKLYWEMICADQDSDEGEKPAQPFDEFDELAQRRAS